MILADKIIKLRKQFGWSQEELAERLSVSRQSVSKWESANSIPDLNKIIKLGEIFGVSTDYLVKDDIEQVESISEDNEPGILKITLEMAKDYIDKKMNVARLTSIGVLIVILSVAPLMMLLALSSSGDVALSSNTATAIGLVLLFVMVSLAVSFFIRTTSYTNEISRFESGEFELIYGVRSIIKEKLEKFKPKYNLKVSISVMMFITSVIPLLLASLLGGSNNLVLMMLVVLFLMVGFGVYLIVPVSARYSAYNCLIGEGDYQPSKKEETKKIESFAAFYWPLVTAIYIGWSLWTMAWGTTWIVWPVAGILFAALVGLLGMFDSNRG